MLPPPSLPPLPTPPPPAAPLVQQAPPVVHSDRWSVRVELVEDEVARLYGQGLARGALVWKKGMLEWRPLLITPELTSLLRHTRITLSESNPPPEPSEPVTAPRLPAPARVPSEAMFADESGRRVPQTVAPTAMDVPPPAPSKPRYDLICAAALSFGLAWFGQAALSSDPEPAVVSVVAAAAEATPQPVAVPLPKVTPPVSTIPQVAVADLPLIAGHGASRGGGVRTASARVHAPGNAKSASEEGPSRAALVNAMSQVASIAGGCGERGGAVRVVVTFATSGVARSIKVSGQDLPPATRSCIIGAASRARIPSFSGDPVTVSKTL